MKIAILLDAEGRAASFTEQGTIYVYERRDDVWAADRKQDFVSAAYTTMADLRSYICKITAWLGECKVLAAKRSNGYYRLAFEGCGVALWAVEGSPPQFISQIESFYTKSPELQPDHQPAAVPSKTYITPIPGKTGFYAADLRDVMAHKAGINSRELLLPFFEEAQFERLEIICDHVPRWFNEELGRLNLKAVSESDGRQTKVHVYPVGH
ncbi:Fe-only nitrogenase accessory AnfO family protein [Treponema primitia]|uniref:Fe-only nitrogenase accessory AnfO family protein n=1 Tax=Treponema primitia TaxID=88058 RepID=UPI0002554DBD|nr:Fe-only nitrogenase accessory AnfO family protein [Treponema primitia]